MIRIEYDRRMSKAEVNLLENIWRDSINESIRNYNEDRSRVLTLRTCLPFDIWMRIFSMVHPQVLLIKDVRNSLPEGMYHADYLYRHPQQT